MARAVPTELPIAISTGDPAGIGPEIALRAAASFDRDCVLVGDKGNLTAVAKRLGITVDTPIEATTHCAEQPIAPGNPCADSGEQAFQAITRATAMVQAGTARALVTAPIAKAALQLAGHHYPGHTELLAELAGAVPVRMMLANPELRVILVTVHEPLRQALEQLSSERILGTLQIAHHSLQAFGINAPRLAVAGVNPHASENGLFGDEEARIIAPAIAQACALGINASGPYPPDTIFMRARGLTQFDAVIAMYHDQGLIPIKYLGVEHGVNVTLGLPFVRTSPDHGTAFDIAGTGRADPASMLAALQMADRLSRHRGTPD